MLFGLTKLAVGAATVMTDVAGSGDVTETVENGKKWYETINENLDKPQATAIVGVAAIVAIGLCIYHFGFKKLLRKKRGK